MYLGKFSLRINYFSCLEAEHLVRSMIERDPKNRPSTADVLRHPLFWSSYEKMKFIDDVNSKLATSKNREKPIENYAMIKKTVDNRFRAGLMIRCTDGMGPFNGRFGVFENKKNLTEDEQIGGFSSFTSLDNWKSNLNLKMKGFFTKKETGHLDESTVLDLIRLGAVQK